MEEVKTKKKDRSKLRKDRIHKLCSQEVSYNYRNLFKLMSVAPNVMNCRVNTTYFIKNYEILLKYFDELEAQTPWKHMFYYACEDCISYFGESITA